MSEAPKGISIKPPGSFVSKEKITEVISSAKAAEEINKAQDEAEKSRAEAEEKKRIEEIEKLLPARVFSSHGAMSYAAFKGLYGAVWEQVKNKDHLSVGYCTFSAELIPNVQGVMRTLRASENRASLRWMPEMDDRGIPVNQAADAFYRNVRLTLGLIEFDGRRLMEVPALVPGEEEQWLDHAVVQQKLAWIDGLPEEVVFELGGVMADLTNAYRLALRENLKNRLAPPSLS